MNTANKPDGPAGIAWPGLIVLLGSICAYWLAQNDLETSRPKVPSAYQIPDPVGSKAVAATPSRMWEDPISTTYDHWKKSRPGPLPDHPVSRFIEIDRRKGNDSQEEDLRSLFANLVGEYEGVETLCLPILVNGGRYAEDKETRLRTRYAVVTALAHAGYKLSYPERLSYAEVSTEVLAMKEGEEWTKQTLIIPVKLYRPMPLPEEKVPQDGESKASPVSSESSPPATTAAEGTRSDAIPQILVLWINEAQLGGMPLLALHRITDAMFGGVTDKTRLHFRIIGPSSSDGLEKIYLELSSYAGSEQREHNLETTDTSQILWKRAWGKNPDGPFLSTKIERPIPILSPRATATVSSDRVTTKQTDATDSAIPQFQVIRTIGNDHILVSHAIKQELDTRGAWPEAQKKQVMILLTEHDTSYGRRIVREFEQLFDSTEGGKSDSEPPIQIPLRVLKYLRGADGQTTRETTERSARTESKPNSSGDLYFLPANETATRLPQGESQYDYLRRLKSDLRRLEENRRITAIGVVGSDVYDKLLILRALRPHFPDTVFFTTDLDAIYEHPDELRHTRNLVIASHYGLRLNTKFHDAFGDESTANMSMLPFRDSYQTAEHLTTRIAVGDPGIRDALQQAVPLKYRSSSVMKMALTLWDHEHDHFGRGDQPADYALEGVLRPLITTVGTAGFRHLEQPERGERLTASAPGERLPHQKTHQTTELNAVGEAVAAVQTNENASVSLQPEPDNSARSMRTPLTVLLIGLGIACFLVWDHRESISELLRGTPQKIEGVISFVPPDVRNLQTGYLNVILPLTVMLLVWAVLKGMFGLEQILLDGTSVMPRIFIQILIGMSAALTLVQFSRQVCAMWDRWSPKTHLRLQESGLLDKILSDPEVPRLRPPVMWNMILLACYIFIFVTAVLYHPQIIPLLLLLGIAGLLGTLIWMKMGGGQRSISADPSQNFFIFFQDKSVSKIFPAFALLVGSVAILIAAFAVAEYYTATVFTASGWRPYFMSRGGITTWMLDFSSMLFAQVMVCLLFTSILYGHEWSREFARYLRAKIQEFDPNAQPEPDDRVDSLILIGEATVVTTKYTPWLMVYILALLLAYHPTISPVPIPTGILIVLSISIGVLVASTLYVRRIIQQQRAEVLQDLRGRLFNLRRENAKQDQRKHRAGEKRRSRSRGKIMSQS